MSIQALVHGRTGHALRPAFPRRQSDDQDALRSLALCAAIGHDSRSTCDAAKKQNRRNSKLHKRLLTSCPPVKPSLPSLGGDTASRESVAECPRESVYSRGSCRGVCPRAICGERSGGQGATLDITKRRSHGCRTGEGVEQSLRRPLPLTRAAARRAWEASNRSYRPPSEDMARDFGDPTPAHPPFSGFFPNTPRRSVWHRA